VVRDVSKLEGDGKGRTGGTRRTAVSGSKIDVGLVSNEQIAQIRESLHRRTVHCTAHGVRGVEDHVREILK
jgi:hypothetical protein